MNGGCTSAAQNPAQSLKALADQPIPATVLVQHNSQPFAARLVAAQQLNNNQTITLTTAAGQQGPPTVLGQHNSQPCTCAAAAVAASSLTPTSPQPSLQQQVSQHLPLVHVPVAVQLDELERSCSKNKIIQVGPAQSTPCAAPIVALPCAVHSTLTMSSSTPSPQPSLHQQVSKRLPHSLVGTICNHVLQRQFLQRQLDTQPTALTAPASQQAPTTLLGRHNV
jgi:hypothetical protein